MRSRPERAGALLVAAALLAALLPGALPRVPASAAAPAPVRILLLGDSVTQGSEGDWTWRYRLWRHLRSAAVSFDLVGPDRGLRSTGEAGEPLDPQAYADPAFDRDHAARWGRSAGEGAALVADGLVGTADPDVLVVMLGVNDLLGGRSVDQAVDSLRALVAAAREASPDIDVVLGEMTQTWFSWGGDPRVVTLNGRIAGLVAELDSEESSVVLAAAAAGYRPKHTWDNSHPSATGEVRVAAAVADALAELGVGAPYVGALSAPPVPRRPAALTAVPGDGRVSLTWTVPPGATASWVWRRDASRRQPWTRMPFPVVGGSLSVAPLANYHRFEFRVQASKGTQVSDVFSPTVSAKPRRPAPGRVRHLGVRGLDRRLAVSWRPAARATSYAVRWAPRARPRAVRARRTTTLAVDIRRLVPGREYRVWVRALNDRTPGPWRTRTVRVRG